MLHDRRGPAIPLPKGWHRHVRSAVLHVLSLAQFAVAYTTGWAVNSINARIRLKAEAERLSQEVALLREEAQSALPDPGQGEDRTDVVARRSAHGTNDGGSNPQGGSRTRANASSRI